VVVLVAFVIYVSAATLWVRAQYAESLDSRLTVPKRGVVWGLCGGGVLVGVAGGLLAASNGLADSPLRPGGLILVGVLMFYLGLGFVIMRSRSRIGRAEDPGKAKHKPDVSLRERLRRLASASQGQLACLLIVMLAVVTVGLFLLGRVPIGWAGAVIALGVVAFPFTLNLLSEYAIREFADARRRKRLLTLGVGVALVIFGTVVSWRSGGTWVPPTAMLVLALLIVALASATLADVAVVLAAVALMGVTPAQDSELAGPPRSSTKVLVALGDSYMSGEGASTFIKGTDEGDGNECRRATSAWPVLASEQPPFDGLVFLACSGADTSNVRDPEGDDLQPEPTEQTGEAGTQLAEYADKYKETVRDPALVVLSIGGNDAGFSTIGLTCLAPGDCNADEPSRLWSKGNLDRVENRLRQTYAQVRKEFGSSPVAVVPYVNPVAESAPCPEADLSGGDVEFIRTFLEQLNARIKAVASDYGFNYVDSMVSALKDHHLQLCDEANNGRPGLNFIGLRSVNGLAEQRFNPTRWHHNSLHPNERGHAAMLVAFQRWLADSGGLDALQTPEKRSANPVGKPVSETYATVPGQDCAAYQVDGPHGCKAQSTAWAERETGLFVLKRGILALVVIAGAWLAGVAFFGGRRAASALEGRTPL
jgi:lysophospholipase L1-like esterase